ncbi:hypothetical protein BMI79_09750 [Serratia oryzae]|uniref:Uncharacterized protein n=1 Tax=Serratia oryzae TaxID=2034155 RepID=A0A1S8CLD6_9GAMM|nr:hypothetical protein BMI79_09750 [Serratia oryzae]
MRTGTRHKPDRRPLTIMSTSTVAALKIAPLPHGLLTLIYGVYCVPRSPSASFFNMKYINFVDEFKSSALLKG